MQETSKSGIMMQRRLRKVKEQINIDLEDGLLESESQEFYKLWASEYLADLMHETAEALAELHELSRPIVLLKAAEFAYKEGRQRMVEAKDINKKKKLKRNIERE